MINRILIRIKVVQMLYAYLLTQNDFKVEQPPQINSRVRQFAYSIYLDLIGLMLALSDYSRNQPAMTGRGRRPKISGIHTTLAASMADDMEVRELINTGAIDKSRFAELVPALYDKIMNSVVYQDYKKKRSNEPEDEVRLWTALLETTIASDSTLIKTLRSRQDFSIQGFDLAVDMLVSTLRNFIETSQGIVRAHQGLSRSLDDAYRLYIGMFLLAVQITEEQERRLEAAKGKYLATSEDLNPNMRFVNNRFIQAIRDCEAFQNYLKDNPMTWDGDTTFIRSMVDMITSSDIYDEYMSFDEVTFSDDCEFWRRVFKYIIFPSDELADKMESMSIYWNDDLCIMGTFVLKSVRYAANSPQGTVTLLPKYKDDEDARFGRELFDYSVENFRTYRSYINKFVNENHWDADRLAFMDLVVMYAALSEFINFPAIPVPVTMNEYVEIANDYCSPRSGQFINGILYSVISHLKEIGLMEKNPDSSSQNYEQID